MDFTCPGLSSFFGQKMENVQVFGKTHLVTLINSVYAISDIKMNKNSEVLIKYKSEAMLN